MSKAREPKTTEARRPKVARVRQPRTTRAILPKTTCATKEDVKRDWLLFDASGKTLGRFAAELTKVLRGKHKPDFTSHIDTGDGVIVIHAEKIKVTGAKEAQKIYKYHTGFMSGLREIPYAVMKDRNPEYIIERAVKGMMPKTRLAEQQYKRLRVYRGAEFDQAAQHPIAVNV
jgi:large subunit ribosomal protein L13